MRVSPARIPGPLVGLGIAIYCVIHCFLRMTLDLSDHPGPAGTQTLYRAAYNTDKVGHDNASEAILYIQHYLDTGIATSSIILSFCSGLMMVIGASAGGWAIAGRKGALGAGVMAALWPLLLFFSILTGVDPLAMGLAWLGVGLSWASLKAGWFGVPLALLAATVLPIAASTKQVVLPCILLAPLMVLFTRKHAALLVTIPAYIYTFYWSHSWFWPTDQHRLQKNPDLNLDSFVSGWKSIRRMDDNYNTEGTFWTLMILAVLVPILIKRIRVTGLIIGIANAALLMLVADSLNFLVRPRYLAPTAFGMLCVIGAGLPLLLRSAQLRWLPLAAGALVFFIESWAFFYSFDTERSKFAASISANYPRPPDYWRQRYWQRSPLLQRDISLYGAAEMARLNNEFEFGTAVPRLRDARERSLMALAAMEGKPFGVLDPGPCCRVHLGQYCAKNIVDDVNDAGLLLVLPKQVKGVNRVEANEVNWTESLINAAKAKGDTFESAHWIWRFPTGSGGKIPCQKGDGVKGQ